MMGVVAKLTRGGNVFINIDAIVDCLSIQFLINSATDL